MREASTVTNPSDLIQAYDALMAEAKAKGMDVDIETATLVPRRQLNHHERDAYYWLKADRERFHDQTQQLNADHPEIWDGKEQTHESN